MQNNFFEIHDTTAFFDAFFDWILNWVHYPGQNLVMEQAAKGLLDRLLGAHKPDHYDSLEIYRGKEFHFLVWINDEIALIICNRSMTLKRRQRLFELQRTLSRGEKTEIRTPVHPWNIHVVYFELFLPISSIREVLPADENLTLQLVVQELEECYACKLDQVNSTTSEALSELDRINALKVPFENKFLFDELVMFLQQLPSGKEYLLDAYRSYISGVFDEVQQWQTTPLENWNIRESVGFFRHIERHTPTCSWNVTPKTALLRWHVEVIPADLELRNIPLRGLALEIRGHFERGQWEIIISCITAKPAESIPTMWCLFDKLKEKLEQLEIPCYKKRFLPEMFVPIIGIALHLDTCKQTMQLLKEVICQFEWNIIIRSCLKNKK